MMTDASEILDAVARLPEVDQLAGRRVCVVGCTGLIGSAVMAVLLRANNLFPNRPPIRVLGMARRPPEGWIPGHRAMTFVEGSADDPEVLRSLPPCDHVIYVAGTASDYRRRVRETINTQIVGLEAFLRRCRDCLGFVYVSSTRVYGRTTGAEPLTEDHPAVIAPMHLDNLYDSAKRFAESLCLQQAQEHGLPVKVVRPTNIYGLPDTLRTTTAITEFVTESLTHRRIVLRGHPESLRNYCGALDLAQGLLRALVRGQSGRAYNIGSEEHLTGSEVAQQVAAAFPFPIDIIQTSGKEAPSCQRIAITRAREELGYEPQQRFSLTVPRMVERIASLAGTPLCIP